jgi:hypothetical protein
MNIHISKHQQYKSIIRVLDNHPEAFEGKDDLLTHKQQFSDFDNRIEELISILIAPVSIVYAPKRESQAALRDKLKRMTGLGILIARKHNNQNLLQTMNVYKALVYKSSSYKLHENAVKVAEAIELHIADAGNFGFTASEVQQFRTMVTAFNEVISETKNQINDRKVNRSELHSLFKECNRLLKEQFDPFILFASESFPALYREYSLIRSKGGRRRNGSANDAINGEISGSVFDTVTGTTVAGATITIPEYNQVAVTDEDGYYLFDELTAGTYKLTCSCPGYLVPAIVTVILDTNNSVVDADINLTPITGEQAA